MKKIISLVFLVSLWACDDGDLQIDTIDFDSASIQNCDGVSTTTTNILFKINSTEALILELPNGVIASAVTTTDIVSNVSASGPSKITYRIFSDNVTQSYFCSEIPLTEPVVTDEIIAQGGEVRVTTTLSADGANHVHEIKLSEISLVTSDDSRITNLAIDNFGEVTTPVPQ